MATMGLKGIWGLEQLDKTGIATWKLGVLLIGGGALFGAILIPILGEVNPDSVLAPFYTARVVALLLVFFPFAAGFLVFLTFVLVRTVETDLGLLSSIDDVVDESIKRLRPTKKTLLTTTLVVMMIDLLLLPVINVVPAINAMTLNMTITESFSAIHSSGLVVNVLQYPLLIMTGLAGGVFISIIITQSLSLMHAARSIKIDLLQLSQYSAIANPIVRLFMLGLVVLSVWPPMILFIDDPVFSSALSWLAMLVILAGFPLVFLYVYPILILKNRIRDEKQKELNIVFQSLKGNDEAIKAISIQGLGRPTSTADLLTHQMFLESRWELPIASHIQNLILFGLLPPIAWGLAATMEYALYG